MAFFSFEVVRVKQCVVFIPSSAKTALLIFSVEMDFPSLYSCRPLLVLLCQCFQASSLLALFMSTSASSSRSISQCRFCPLPQPGSFFQFVSAQLGTIRTGAWEPRCLPALYFDRPGLLCPFRFTDLLRHTLLVKRGTFAGPRGLPTLHSYPSPPWLVLSL